MHTTQGHAGKHPSQDAEGAGGGVGEEAWARADCGSQFTGGVGEAGRRGGECEQVSVGSLSEFLAEQCASWAELGAQPPLLMESLRGSGTALAGAPPAGTPTGRG